MRIKLIVFLVSFFTITSYAQDTLIFNNLKKNFHVGGEKLLVYEDRSNRINSPLELLGREFKKLPSHFFMNENPASTYWLKLMVVDSSYFDQHWFFISYNGNVDSFQMFAIDNGKQLFTNEYHYKSTKMSERDLAHKNFTMEFAIPKSKPIEVFIKIKNPKSFQYGFAFREHKEYFSSSIHEYYIFGLFYGGIILLALYQLTFFFSLKDYAHLFYVGYIVIQGIYMCFRDATALVFLFPNKPYLLESSYSSVMFLLAISVLLYARFFLQLKSYSLFNKAIVIFAIIRIPFFLLLPDYPIELMWLDFSAIFMAFVFSVVSLIQKQKTAILFTISFGVIILGHLVNVLWHANIIPCTDHIFYSLYFAVGIETLLLAVANAHRLTALRERALLKDILEKKVSDSLKKIKEQQVQIKEKSDELDVFLYRASHDIKGPLLSIEGLSKVGKLAKDNKDEYFELITKSSIRLQKILNSLLNLAKENRRTLKTEPVNLYELIKECVNEHLKEYPGFEDLTLNIHVQENAIIYSDKYLLLSVVQNLIENAIKYRDQTKEVKSLTISLIQTNELNSLIFRDNGLGISQESLKKIFQMFFRANTDAAEGSGLGLYIVKQNVERLNGKVSIESKQHEYTMIRLDFQR